MARPFIQVVNKSFSLHKDERDVVDDDVGGGGRKRL